MVRLIKLAGATLVAVTALLNFDALVLADVPLHPVAPGVAPAPVATVPAVSEATTPSIPCTAAAAKLPALSASCASAGAAVQQVSAAVLPGSATAPAAGPGRVPSATAPAAVVGGLVAPVMVRVAPEAPAQAPAGSRPDSANPPAPLAAAHSMQAPDTGPWWGADTMPFTGAVPPRYGLAALVLLALGVSLTLLARTLATPRGQVVPTRSS